MIVRNGIKNIIPKKMNIRGASAGYSGRRYRLFCIFEITAVSSYDSMSMIYSIRRSFNNNKISESKFYKKSNNTPIPQIPTSIHWKIDEILTLSSNHSHMKLSRCAYLQFSR
jgi:hypothetical protein